MSCEHAKTTPWTKCSDCSKCGEDGLCDLCRFGNTEAPAEEYHGPLHKCPDTIRVCEACLFLGAKREIPLIFTFAFNGFEYWCPYCGNKSDMFGGEEVPWSEKLYNRRHRYKENFKPYLMANSSLNCSQLMWDGEWIAPNALPVPELDRLRDLVETAWKPGVIIL